MKKKEQGVKRSHKPKEYWNNNEHGEKLFIGSYEYFKHKITGKEHRVFVLHEAVDHTTSIGNKIVSMMEVYESHEKAKKVGWVKCKQ